MAGLSSSRVESMFDYYWFGTYHKNSCVTGRDAYRAALAAPVGQPCPADAAPSSSGPTRQRSSHDSYKTFSNVASSQLPPRAPVKRDDRTSHQAMLSTQQRQSSPASPSSSNHSSSDCVVAQGSSPAHREVDWQLPHIGSAPAAGPAAALGAVFHSEPGFSHMCAAAAASEHPDPQEPGMQQLSWRSQADLCQRLHQRLHQSSHIGQAAAAFPTFRLANTADWLAERCKQALAFRQQLEQQAASSQAAEAAQASEPGAAPLVEMSPQSQGKCQQEQQGELRMLHPATSLSGAMQEGTRAVSNIDGWTSGDGIEQQQSASTSRPAGPGTSAEIPGPPQALASLGASPEQQAGGGPRMPHERLSSSSGSSSSSSGSSQYPQRQQCVGEGSCTSSPVRLSSCTEHAAAGLAAAAAAAAAVGCLDNGSLAEAGFRGASVQVSNQQKEQEQASTTCLTSPTTSTDKGAKVGRISTSSPAVVATNPSGKMPALLRRCSSGNNILPCAESTGSSSSSAASQQHPHPHPYQLLLQNNQNNQGLLEGECMLRSSPSMGSWNLDDPCLLGSSPYSLQQPSSGWEGEYTEESMQKQAPALAAQALPARQQLERAQPIRVEWRSCLAAVKSRPAYTSCSVLVQAGRETSGGPGRSWLGLLVPAATLDQCGAFDLVLARVLDAACGHSRLVLRGRRRAGPSQLLDDLRLELGLAARQHGLPMQVSVALLGQGRLEYEGRSARLEWGSGAASAGGGGHEELDPQEQRCVAAALARLAVPQGCALRA